MSIWLRAKRTSVFDVRAQRSPGADAFLRQLAWRDFYTQVLGFRSRGAMRVPGTMVPKGDPDGRYYVRFLSTNERHHTLALGPWWQPNGISVSPRMVELNGIEPSTS